MHELDLLLTLTGGLAAALALGYVTHRLGLSPIVGYLLAGILVGEHTPGFHADPHLAEQMAHVGVILLMFGVGLQFHFKELLAVRNVALPGAVVQSLVATLLGMLLAWSFGWSWEAGLVFGLALSVASTVVLVRVLSDNHDLHTPAGHIAVGWLVVEDLFTVVALVLLPALFGNAGAAPSNLPLALGLALLKIGALVALAVFVGGRLIPWLLERVAATRSRELFTLTVLVVALGIAVGSAQLFGVSMELGAFLAGMIVGRSDFSSRAAADALPMRDAFAVLFFVSIGMLFNPSFLLEAPLLVAATLAIVLLAKPLTALAIVWLLRYPPRIALAVAVALGQIGEFSFILASLGRQLGIFEGAMAQAALNTLVATALISITLNPLLYRLLDTIEARAVRVPWLWNWLNGRARQSVAVPGSKSNTRASPPARHRAIVVGYGPVGQTATRLLQASEIEPTIIELNMDTVRELRAKGERAIYGDASHRETLVEAGIDQTRSLILTSSTLKGSEEVIRLARELNPKIRVFARSNYLREVQALHRAGADAVFASEGEVALTMTEFLLRHLGATAEQIDRERERIRRQLFGGAVEVAVAEKAAGRIAADSPQADQPAAEAPAPSARD